MASLSELRLHQNVYLPAVDATGVVVEIDDVNDRVKVDYTLRGRQRRRLGPSPDRRTGWFAPADLTIFHWAPFHDFHGLTPYN